jgi:hypothetical protein
MKYFFWKLIPPRPTFAADMTGAEASLMQQHAAYWKAWMDKGRVAAFGLVDAPEGVYGIGIVLADDAELEALRTNEPTIRAGVGFRFEAYPMPLATVRP